MKNYEILKQKFVEEVNSDVTLLKHTLSGAHVLLFKNSDQNKVFSIGFRTPPTNDTGVPHILEHSTLCGSKKFPVKDPFIELLKSSLNTFLNAMTYPDKTLYPVASLNDHDFQNLMEVYMDAVFYPNVYDHEEIFKQEGWHYELEASDKDIIYNGVVYNEMKGVFSSPEQVIMRVSRHAIFPDTTYGVESGGDPEFIPDLTYQEFLNFHSKYYHPSNSYIILYGDIDMDEKLKWMDEEYLSKFTTIDPNSKISYQAPFDKPRFEEYFYPIGKEESLDNKTYYSYNVCISEYKDVLTNYAFLVLNYVLFDSPAAIVKKEIQKRGLATEIISEFDSGMMQTLLSIIVKNAPSNKLDELKELINSTLVKTVSDGIDKKTLLSAINFYEFKYREADFGGAPAGLVYAINAMETWLYDENDALSNLEFYQIFATLKKLVETDYFEKLIKEKLLNNNHVAYVTLSPSKTIGAEKELATKEKLAKYKASLTADQINDLVEQTKALKAYQEAPSTKEELATIPRLTKDDIKKEAEELPNEKIIVDDTTVITHNIDSKGISYIDFYFSTLGISNELIPYVGLLKRILTNVDTKSLNFEELLKEINIKTGGINPVINVFSSGDNDVLGYFCFNTKALDNEVGHIFELLKIIIKESIFTNKARIKEIIMEASSQLQMSFMSGGHVASINRAFSYIRKSSAYSEAINGIDQYEFLNTLLSDYDASFTKITENLNLVASYIFRKENLTISYTGQSEEYKKYLKDFNQSLYTNEIKVSSFSFNKELKNEGFMSPSTVQYVARVGNFSHVGSYTGAFVVLKMALSYDYLWMKVRVLGGAYGCMCDFIRNGNVYFVSYRDPNLEKTNEVYDQIPFYLNSFFPSDEELTSYIIGAIGLLDTPLTPHKKGNKAFVNYLLNVTNEDVQKERLEVINCTKDDIYNLKPLIEEALNAHALCAIGNETKIGESEIFRQKKYLIK